MANPSKEIQPQPMEKDLKNEQLQETQQVVLGELQPSQKNQASSQESQSQETKHDIQEVTKKNEERYAQLAPDRDEVGVMGLSLALTAIAGGIIFSDKVNILIKLLCLIIYTLGGLATSFLYFTFLVNKIPKTINLWMSNGGMGVRGQFWICKYYIKIFWRQMFYLRTGHPLSTIRELGYLTILAMLALLWISFGLVLINLILSQ